jgi:hypothetical protein
VPALYQRSVRSEQMHAAQHTSVLAAVVTGGLGALLTVAPHPLCQVYAPTTRLWGLSPLEDQKLARLIMWIPEGLSYLLAALWLVRAWLAESDRRVHRWENATRSLALLLLAAGTGVLSACSGSPEEKARETARLTRAARARGAVPEAYARQMLDAADDELRKLQ